MEDLEQTANVQDYLDKITSYETEFKRWEGRVEKILKRYRDDEREKSSTGARFNILWSNVNILVPAVFAKLPKPDVSRRFRDQDSVGRVAGMLMERTLTYEIDSESDYQQALKSVVFDRFIGARGQAWVRYEPRFIPAQKDGFEITEDAESESEILDWEHSPVDYVHWRDFGHTIARTWEEVTAVWRRVYLSRDALIERFGDELGNSIPLDTTPEDLKKAGIRADSKNSQAAIYEIWDKSAGIAVWVSKSMSKILDEKKDPLKLTCFWPCPRPLYGSITTDNLVPIPDYTLYQDQANELDVLSDRIDGLIKALRVRGVYDASVPELARVFTEGDNNTLIPVKNWQAFVEKQGLKGAIDLVDIEPIARALTEAYSAMEQVKSQIYEITGISDIIRGDTDANETASAQRLKSSYGNLRLKSAQEEVARFATELLQIKAQIICNFYRPETIVQASAAQQMSQADQQFIMPAMQLLKDNALRTFRIEIESDSMVQLDEDKVKADRIEFLGAVANFLRQSAEAAQSSPQIVPLAMEMLKFGASAFKAGKQLEGIIDQTAEELKQQIAQQQANPQPSAEQQKMQSDAQMAQAKMQQEAQLQQMKVQADQQSQQLELQSKVQLDAAQKQHEMQLEEFKSQKEMQIEQWRQQMQSQDSQHQNELEAQRDQLQASNEAQLEQLRIERDREIALLQQDLDRWKAELDNNTKIVVAEISAKTQLETSAMSASASSETENTSVDGKKTTKNSLTALVDAMNTNLGKLMDAQTQSHQQLIETISKPKKIVRDSDGKVIGTE